jgi:hypothetical protein
MMLSSIFSFEARSGATPTAQPPARWRRFLAVLLGVGGGGALVIWLFIMLVDPFGSLPISLPFDRGPVDSNARYAFPMLARDPQFDSAVLGTSTSRLFRPALLNPMLDAHFANLAMNSATAYEQSRIFEVFLEHHPAPRAVMIGLDVQWCVAAESFQKFTDREFPEWLYTGSRWAGYREMADLYSIEKAGQAFAEWTGLKRRVYGRDGYTSFVPDESRWNAARVAELMRGAMPYSPPDDLTGDPKSWPLPGVDLLKRVLAPLPPQTLKLLVFIAPSRHLVPPPDTRSAAIFNECKRRIANLAATMPNAAVIDFLIPSPITDEDANYWDAWHVRAPIADRIVADIGAALHGASSPDYRVLHQDVVQSLGDADRHADAGEVK